MASKPRMRERYQQEIAPALMKEFGYQNVMQVPRLLKVTVNIGMGEAVQNAKSLDAAAADLTAITGQKPVITRAKKSIANFKIREGMPIGMMVTLRGDRMYEFLDRFLSIALPRVRDFQGVPANAFDGRGNYSVGIREQLIFPEIEYDKIDRIRGMQVTIVTSARSDEEARALLRMFGMPFQRAQAFARAG
jgi:large subunit ribosomal protein L5